MKKNRPHPLSRETIEKLRNTSTATLTGHLLKRGYRNTFLTGIKPIRADLRMVGYAFTLRYVPTREDIGYEFDNNTNVQRLAVEAIEADDVLVIDARNEIGSASFGHIIATRIRQRGAAGLVTDGALRDTPSFHNLDLPAYARAAHAGTSSVLHYPVDMNVPIGCAGVLVMPGDIVVGDAEGVVVIPAGEAEPIAHDASEAEALEAFILKKVERGESIKNVYPPSEETKAEFRKWREQE